MRLLAIRRVKGSQGCAGGLQPPWRACPRRKRPVRKQRGLDAGLLLGLGPQAQGARQVLPETCGTQPLL